MNTLIQRYEAALNRIEELKQQSNRMNKEFERKLASHNMAIDSYRRIQLGMTNSNLITKI